MSALLEYGNTLAAVFVAFALGMIAGTLFNKMMYAGILIGKAKDKDRTPEHIGDGFYYIVPEKEYVEMHVAYVNAKYPPRRQADAVNGVKS